MKNFIKKTIEQFQANKIKISWWLIFALLIGCIAHGYNMFNFPYYENDEGVYMSQAWSLVTNGELAPYTYWYDHAPGGWFFISLWTMLTGGFFSFGFSINSGRVLMLLLHILSSIFIYFITKKYTGSKKAGALSVLFFSLSPLAIYFQRRILLDNIMIFWVLLSFLIIINYRKKLRYIFLSAFVFAAAVLSKENAIFFIPIFLYVIFLESHKKHRSFALVKWLSVMGSLVSFYFLFALIKGEFFPVGFFGDSTEHVSLLSTLKFQLSRGGGSIFHPESSAFWEVMKDWWLESDPLIIYAGITATVVNLFIGIKNIPARIVSLLSLSYWYFLARGGMVLEFYIVPLIPFLAMNISFSISFLYKKIKKINFPILTRISRLLIVAGLIIYFGYSIFVYSDSIRTRLNLYKSDQTIAQLEAAYYIAEYGESNDLYVIDNYAYVDLHAVNQDLVPRTEWYWKVDSDPEIRDKVLFNNPRNISYLAVTPQMEEDLLRENFNLVGTALYNARSVKNFWYDDWGVEIWQTKFPEDVLESSWESYKNAFIRDGRVFDSHAENYTTSEAQSYALLRAAWIDDEKTFLEVFKWTKENMQDRNNLFAWRWQVSKEDEIVIDQGTATDADQDIALSLLFAYKKWGNEEHLLEAKKILNGIWDFEIVEHKGEFYLSAGNWGNTRGEIIMNPSYFSPASYRIFAEVDKNHEWLKVVESSYELLRQSTNNKLDKTKGVLPPEWFLFDKKEEIVKTSHAPYPEDTDYAYNAFRIPWRIGLDYLWFGEQEAHEYLSSLEFFYDEWKRHERIYAAYSHDGEIVKRYEATAAYGGNLAYFKIVHPELEKKVYDSKILRKLFETDSASYWDTSDNYYSQNWAWFGTALFANQLTNLWQE